MDENMEMIIGLTIGAIILLLIYGLFIYLIVTMTKSRGRSIFGWLVFALFFTPLITMLILFLLGDTDKRRLQKIQEEEEQRISIRRKYSEENKH